MTYNLEQDTIITETRDRISYTEAKRITIDKYLKHNTTFANILTKNINQTHVKRIEKHNTSVTYVSIPQNRKKKNTITKSNSMKSSNAAKQE